MREKKLYLAFALIFWAIAFFDAWVFGEALAFILPFSLGAFFWGSFMIFMHYDVRKKEK